MLADQLYSDSWCTSFPSPFGGTITPGYTVGAGLCGFNYDDTQYEIDFTRPVISPTCTDAGEIWHAWLEPQAGDYNSEEWKIAIDLNTDKIYVTGHTGESDNTEQTFTAHFRLPDGTESTFDFSVDPQFNSVCTLTAPTSYTATHTYGIGAAASSYPFPSFTVNPASCDITYSSTVVGAATSDTSFFTDLST